MNATELYVKTESGEFKPSGVWFCGKCNRIPSDLQPRGRKEAADQCCKPRLCSQCGGPLEGSICRPCRDKKQREEEQARIDAATKLVPDEYDGPVYDGNDYWLDVDEYREHAEDEGIEDEYVWACTTHRHQIDPQRAVDIITEDMLQDVEDADECMLSGVQELKEFIAEWNKRQTGEYCRVDYKRAIMVPKKALEAAP